MKLKISPVIEVFNSIEKVINFCSDWERKREDLEFETDGMVIKVDSYEQQKILGTTTKNPRYSIAFKFPAKQATTRLIDIICQVGRTGILTPVAHLEPVLLAGSTISRCTLHNEDEIKRKDIRIGDTVIIEKGGDVIPKIVKSVESKRTGEEKIFAISKHCPVCRGKVVRVKDESASRCTNASCPAQVHGMIEHFASRTAMDIEGLGTSLISQLLKLGLIKDYGDLYYLEKEKIAKLERMGEKSAENLISAVEKSKKRDFAQIIFALGVNHVGIHIADLLSGRYGSMEKLIKASENINEIELVLGIGKTVAESIHHFFRESKNIKVINKLVKAGINMKRIETSGKKVLNGETFVFTGELTDFTRIDAEKLVKQSGGRVSSSVSKKTNYVVVGKDPGSKYDKAVKLKVKIIAEEEFKKIIKK